VNSATKLLEAMRQSSLDWKLGQLQTVATAQGLKWRHKGGSHCVFLSEEGRTLSVPARRPIKPIYIKHFLALIDGE
jgi:hypothetical protein